MTEYEHGKRRTMRIGGGIHEFRFCGICGVLVPSCVWETHPGGVDCARWAENRELREEVEKRAVGVFNRGGR